LDGHYRLGCESLLQCSGGLRRVIALTTLRKRERAEEQRENDTERSRLASRKSHIVRFSKSRAQSVSAAIVERGWLGSQRAEVQRSPDRGDGFRCLRLALGVTPGAQHIGEFC